MGNQSRGIVRKFHLFKYKKDNKIYIKGQKIYIKGQKIYIKGQKIYKKKNMNGKLVQGDCQENSPIQI